MAGQHVSFHRLYDKYCHYARHGNNIRQRRWIISNHTTILLSTLLLRSFRNNTNPSTDKLILYDRHQ